MKVDWDHVARLVTTAQAGDDGAFRRLLDTHRRTITSTLVACGVRCPETARDLAQEVCLRAWRKLPTLNDPRAFPAWLRRIAANAARDHLRRLAVRREEALETALDLTAGDTPHDVAERTSELRLMLAALADEEPETVELLMARADGVPVSILAAPHGITEAAMKMRLMRVRKRLRQKLQALRGEQF